MNPLTLSIIGLYKTAVIRRRGSWRTHAGHGVDGSTQPVPHAGDGRVAELELIPRKTRVR